jgi:hypothetical protein|tara:strand:+ start:5594 stop:6043 length:450 start_codon:yes stop_codon:yes gene_type:complete
MEKVITCPNCLNSDQCFEEVQETFSSYLCFHCGFMSDSRYEIGSLKLIENLKKSPKLVRDSRFEDTERGIVWFPSVINMGKLGMIFPEGDVTNYVWKYAKVIDIPEKERVMYDNHTQRLDVNNAETFSQYNFLKACEMMGITKDLSKDA